MQKKITPNHQKQAKIKPERLFQKRGIAVYISELVNPR